MCRELNHLEQLFFSLFVYLFVVVVLVFFLSSNPAPSMFAIVKLLSHCLHGLFISSEEWFLEKVHELRTET